MAGWRLVSKACSFSVARRLTWRFLATRRLQCVVLRRRRCRSTCGPRRHRQECVVLCRLACVKQTKLMIGLPRHRAEFALNAGLRFLTPEECFEDAAPDEDYVLWGWDPFAYDHSSSPLFRSHSYFGCLPYYPAAPDPPAILPPAPPPNSTPHELVLLLGGPASGKTHYYNTHLQPQRYERFVCLPQIALE